MEKDLYMPSNVCMRKEHFKGIGNEEMKYFAYVIPVNVVIGLILMLAFELTISIFFALVLILQVGTFFALKRDEYGGSIVVYLKRIINFANSQRNFKYKYTQWWVKYNEK